MRCTVAMPAAEASHGHILCATTPHATWQDRSRWARLFVLKRMRILAIHLLPPLLYDRHVHLRVAAIHARAPAAELTCTRCGAHRTCVMHSAAIDAVTATSCTQNHDRDAQYAGGALLRVCTVARGRTCGEAHAVQLEALRVLALAFDLRRPRLVAHVAESLHARRRVK